MIIQSFYDVLRTTFENKGILTYSGFQDRTAIPYLFISKIISSLDTRDTFVNRHDTNLVQISYFSKYFSDFNDDLSTIRNLLLYKQLVVPNRRLLNIEELELVRSEPEKGLYQGIFQYEALTEKTLQNFEIKTIEAADLFEALYSRYTNSKLINNTSDFVTTQFGESAYPFLHVPNYEKTLKFGTTKSRIDNIIFSIDFETTEYDKLEEITEDLDNVFSYSRFAFSGSKKVVNLEWLNNTFSEEKPGFWKSSTRYQCMIEEDI